MSKIHLNSLFFADHRDFAEERCPGFGLGLPHGPCGFDHEAIVRRAKAVRAAAKKKKHAFGEGRESLMERLGWGNSSPRLR